MKKLKTIFKILTAAMALAGAVSFTSCSQTQKDENGCFIDIDEAAKFAEKKNQDIMVIVTMDGDDSASSDFLDKVVRDSQFKNDIATKFAVVCMDFSQKTYQTTIADENASKKEKKSAEAKSNLVQKNMLYAGKLNATQTPVVYILSKEQYIITGLFYDDENRSYDGFKTLISEKNELIEEMHKMILQTKLGTAEEKIAAIDALYEKTSPDYRFLLLDLLDSVKKLDPTNKTGLLGKFIYNAGLARADTAIVAGDAKAAIQAYLDVTNEEFVSGEMKQQAMYTVAYMTSMTGFEDVSAVISYLEKAIEFAPESDDVPAIKRVIAAISQQQAQ